MNRVCDHRMRVTHAAKFYPPALGGMETFVQYLCEGTSGEWDVCAVVANQSRSTVEDRCGRVRVVRAGSLGTVASVPLCPSLPFHLWREPADCVVLHEPNPVAGSALWLRTPAPRLIVWHHSDLVRPWWAPYTYGVVQRALYRRADCVVVSNPVLAARSPLVRLARRVEVIPLGIDLEHYRAPDAVHQALVERIRALAPGPRILFVGRFVYYKGIDVLIDAMTRCPGTLMLVGDGSLEGELRTQVATLGLQDRVRFIGRVSDEDLPAYYHASDVFVLPSVAVTEAYGLVQIEAMAAGVPVVSTNLPTGVPWVNQDGVTGLVVPPRDAGALAEAVRRLLGDAGIRRSLGAGGRRRAEALFSRDRTIEAFKHLVETTVHASARLDPRIAQAEPT
jgi:glycosyltransferase involved in cell wall biosynthesis